MQIILNNEWSIKSIQFGYALVRTTVTRGNANNKTSQPRLTSKEVGYYSSVTDALERFVAKNLDNLTEDYVGDLNGYVERIKNITEHCVEEVTKGVEKIL